MMTSTPARTRVLAYNDLTTILPDVDDASPQAWREAKMAPLGGDLGEGPIEYATLTETPATGTVVTHDDLSGMDNVFVTACDSHGAGFVVIDGFPHWLDGSVLRYGTFTEFTVLGDIEIFAPDLDVLAQRLDATGTLDAPTIRGLLDEVRSLRALRRDVTAYAESLVDAGEFADLLAIVEVQR